MTHELPKRLRNSDDLSRLRALGYSQAMIRKGKVIMKKAPTFMESVVVQKESREILDCGLAKITQTENYIWVEQIQTL